MNIRNAIRTDAWLRRGTLMVVSMGSLFYCARFWPEGTVGEAHAAALRPVVPPTPGRPSEPVAPLSKSARDGAALIEGTVVDVTFSYDERRGPRTNARVHVAAVHAGSVPSSEVVVSQFGGPLPDGRWIAANEIPILAKDRRYLLLLANTNWTGFWSAIVGDYAFAIESVGDREVLVGDDGRALVQMSLLGPRFGGAPLFEPAKSDGVTPSRPKARADVTSDSVLDALDVATAVRAIVDAGTLEEVSPNGSLAESAPPWSPWNNVPFEPAPAGSGVKP